MRRGVDRRRHSNTDSQLARVCSHARRERRIRHTGHEGSRRFAAGDDVEHRGGIAHRARDDALHGRPVHGLASRGPRGSQPAAGFQTDQPTAGGRNADRPAAVARTGTRHDPRRDRGCRPARRATRRALKIPRITRRPPRDGLGDPLRPELRGVGLAEDDQARVDPALDDGGVRGSGQRHQCA